MKHFAAVVTLIAGVLAAGPRAQGPLFADDRLTFDVASVRRNTAGAAGPSNMNFSAGGRFTARNLPLRRLIQLAFRIHEFQLAGSQDLLDAHFDINAKAEGNPRADELQSMVRVLLRDRFRLALRSESRELPIYTLGLARRDGTLADDLRRSGAECAPIR
ncbi:MAG TPA: TIGR03435 family protein, partial [Vicinamibacterales bacterium]|nr:TIGR03435 family protein [Vicinamibacterales bacterium]